MSTTVSGRSKTTAAMSPSSLRSDQSIRQQVATQLSGIQSVLDGLMLDRPRRRLIRN